MEIYIEHEGKHAHTSLSDFHNKLIIFVNKDWYIHVKLKCMKWNKGNV
mgnify:CR=1 FL=1